MTCENIDGVIDKVIDRKEFGVGDCFNSFISNFSHFIERLELSWLPKQRVLSVELVPFVSFLEVVSEEHISKLLGCFRVELS